MISSDWLLGFLENNACFSVIIKKSKNSVGYQTQADFSIKLPVYEIETLKKIQDYLGGVGHIYMTEKEAMLKSTKLEDIRMVSAFLGPLNFVSAIKRREFDNWVKCIQIIEAGRHLKRDGLLEIALLRDVMHSKSQWNKKKFCYVRLDLDPCDVYHKEGEIPTGCSICWDEKGMDINRTNVKVDVPIKILEK